MRCNILFILILLPFRMWAETEMHRDIQIQTDSACRISHKFDYPAWSGSTLLVCAMDGSWNLNLVTSEADTLYVNFSWGSLPTLIEPVTKFTAVAANGGDTHEFTLTESKNTRLNSTDYTISLSWDMTQGLAVACNNNLMLSNIPLSAPLKKLTLKSDNGVKITQWLTRAETVSPLHGRMDMEDITVAMQNATDTISGIYHYLDRDADPAKALPGGEYRLALLPVDGSEAYKLCYLEGATVNSGFWHTGTVKAILLPTEFERHYTLKWLDANFKEIDAEQYAEFIDGNILKLVFPLYDSTFRLVRDIE